MKKTTASRWSSTSAATARSAAAVPDELICVNLAGVTTFLVQDIRPATRLEKDRASKATRIAIALWVVLAALGGMILWLGKA